MCHGYRRARVCDQGLDQSRPSRRSVDGEDRSRRGRVAYRARGCSDPSRQRESARGGIYPRPGRPRARSRARAADRLGLASVALAWSSIHTVYALRYARLYYSPPEGGIDFHGDAPDYLDFAYLALTIGMTFQVSDTDLTGKRVRRAVFHHALTSYVFGAVILAITVNWLPLLGGSRHGGRRGPSARRLIDGPKRPPRR